MSTTSSVGDLMREWRKRRRLSQLELAADAVVSARHLSFVESGRAGASRELLLRLGECLAMPLRERNRLLVAAGYAPWFAERSLADPEMHAVRAAVNEVLEGHAPFPALALDRYWTLVAANAPASALLAGVAPRLLQPQVNVLRASLDPEGLAPRIVNLAEWRAHVLHRLRADVAASADPQLMSLMQELEALPFIATQRPGCIASSRIAVPLQLRTVQGAVLSMISTTSVFGTANDITLAELTLECFFPADDATRRFFLSPEAG